MDYVKVTIGAVLGIIGYCFIVRQSFKVMLPTLFAGMIGTFVYFLFTENGYSLFISTLISSFVIEICCEVSARIFHAPAYVFLMPAIITLVPGSFLYYTMSNLLYGNYSLAAENAVKAIQTAAGLADGSICGYVIVSTISEITSFIKKKSNFRQIKHN